MCLPLRPPEDFLAWLPSVQSENRPRGSTSSIDTLVHEALRNSIHLRESSSNLLGELERFVKGQYGSLEASVVNAMADNKVARYSVVCA